MEAAAHEIIKCAETGKDCDAKDPNNIPVKWQM